VLILKDKGERLVKSIPFVSYDFFGYLASGLVVVTAFAFIQDAEWVLTGEIQPVYASLGVVLIYVVGQVVATPAAWLYERLLVKRLLGKPEALLFSEQGTKGWKKLFFEYFEPLTPGIRTSVLRKAEHYGVESPGRELFEMVWGQLKGKEALQSRLSTFLNNYGFARNMSFACLVAGLLILGDWLFGMASQPSHSITWGWASLALSVGLLYRYLKFYRLYTYELFVTYSQIPLERGGINGMKLEEQEEVAHGN
jgi:hypothetical protein